MLKEIYLIHHSHTDIGYTDLPSTTWKLHQEYIRQALLAIDETATYPAEARFHWTCEALFIVEAFLKQATEAEKTRFSALVSAGYIEVAAMPFNITALLSAPEWQALVERLSPLWQRYQARTAFQNDINGFPWGLLPSLKNAGIPYVWMGMNPYSGGSPLPRPAAFWWEGPTGERMLTWNGYGYGDGHAWFHEHEWRRGPVPSVHDIWFHPPTAADTFNNSPQSLEVAAACLQRHLQKTLRPDYSLPILALQTTNRWRIDNDPPCRQLSDFVLAWNAAGLTPTLRLATPSQFLSRIEQHYATDLPVLRGDWVDWWIDGLTSTPVELALNQQTKSLLADLPNAALLLQSSAHLDPTSLSDTWHTTALMDEHTWGAYESVPYPYKPRTLGTWGQKMDLAYRGHEDARLLQAQIIRNSPCYAPTAWTRQITVFNPGEHTRSGWAEISAAALREPFNAVHDLTTNAILPLESQVGVEWGVPAEAHLQRPFAIPHDMWEPVTVQKRFYAHDLPAGAQRRFTLLTTELPSTPTANTNDQNEHFAWSLDPTTGRLLNWYDQHTGHNLIDTQTPYGLGDVIFEVPQEENARQALETHTGLADSAASIRVVPELKYCQPQPSFYSARYLKIWEHPHCHRIEQQWDFIHQLARLELTTTFWLKEIAVPQAIFLAFPCALINSHATYFSLGFPTRVGVDQFPDGCGEYLVVDAGIEFTNELSCLTIATPDSPVGSFERIHTRDGQRSFIPQNAHFYSYVTQNYWATNFSITKAGKLVVRHAIQLGDPGSQLLAATNMDLWTFPSR